MVILHIFMNPTTTALILVTQTIYPLVNQQNYGKSPLLMGKSTISMAMFNSFLCQLPTWHLEMFRLGVHGPLSSHHFGSVGMDFSTWDRKDGTPGVRYGIPMTINDPTCPDVSKRCFEIKRVSDVLAMEAEKKGTQKIRRHQKTIKFHSEVEHINI